MVTATTATLSFKGRSGRVYNVSGYISDVIGAAVTFNPNGAAASTSPSTFQLPEDVVLVDVSILTGPTVATGMVMQSGSTNIPNSNLLIAANLTSVQNRNAPNIGFSAKSLIGAVQF